MYYIISFTHFRTIHSGLSWAENWRWLLPKLWAWNRGGKTNFPYYTTNKSSCERLILTHSRCEQWINKSMLLIEDICSKTVVATKKQAIWNTFCRATHDPCGYFPQNGLENWIFIQNQGKKHFYYWNIIELAKYENFDNLKRIWRILWFTLPHPYIYSWNTLVIL